MEYKTGNIGRIFTIRFDDGDDFLDSLSTLAEKENIKAGWFNIIGGLRQAEVVTGPKEATMPPDPVWAAVDEPQEVIGVGSLFRDENNIPKIHLHTALGHHGRTMTVCVRKGTRTYLILEVYLIEINDINASRPWFPAGGFNRLTFT
ncbi:PPC domain-containing DNA-binding protein [Desulfobacterota bacterium M19]